MSYVHSRTKEAISEEVAEAYWGIDLEIPVFSQDRGYLDQLIPQQKIVPCNLELPVSAGPQMVFEFYS